MTVQAKDPTKVAFARMLAADNVRLWSQRERSYIHIDGINKINHHLFAWRGTRKQADALRKKNKLVGFVTVGLDHTPPPDTGFDK